MQTTRRQVLGAAPSLPACWRERGCSRNTRWPSTRPRSTPGATSDALKALGANGAPEASSAVTLTAPDIAGSAVVPLAVASTLPGIKQLVLLVEKNPNALVAVFNMAPELEASFATRAKMGESSDVYAVAITGDGKGAFRQEEVKVTLGGCGG